MKEQVSIRPAVPQDAQTIHAALRTLAAGVGAGDRMTATVDDLLAHGFGAAPAFEVLVAEADGAFAGLCLTFPSFSTWMGRSGIYVQDLYVAEGFRGHRIGERLLREAARRGRARGARYLRLSVDVENTRAQSFYARLGIRHSRDEQIHMIKGADFDTFAQAEAERP